MEKKEKLSYFTIINSHLWFFIAGMMLSLGFVFNKWGMTTYYLICLIMVIINVMLADLNKYDKFTK